MSVKQRDADPVVDVATEAEAAQAAADLLREAGLSSMEELEAQAASGEFQSERARRAWFILAPLDSDWGTC